MLGGMCHKFFNSLNYEIITINKKVNIKNLNDYIEEINDAGKSIVINCVGKIKQSNSNHSSYFFVNGIFPINLSIHLREDTHLIHPSTDCIYSGNKRNKYEHSDLFDAKDFYGLSKQIGENTIKYRKNINVIRSSIIGPAFYHNNNGLMQWFLNNKLKTIYGYTDHFWNGVTTLEWCKLVNKFILSRKINLNHQKLLNLGTDKVYSKYQILNYIKKIFKKDTIIKPIKYGYSNKSLKPDLFADNLKNQIVELKNFIEKKTNYK